MKISFIFFALLFFFSNQAYASKCMSVFQLLGNRSNVWILKKEINGGEEFRVQKDPMSPLAVATPKNEKWWRVGFFFGSVDVRVFNVRYNLELENNKCANVNISKASSRSNDFMYDWKLCSLILPKINTSLVNVNKINMTIPSGVTSKQVSSFLRTQEKKLKEAYDAVYKVLPKEMIQEFKKEIAKTYKQRNLTPIKNKNFIIETIRSCNEQEKILETGLKEKAKFSKPWSAIDYE